MMAEVFATGRRDDQAKVKYGVQGARLACFTLSWYFTIVRSTLRLKPGPMNALASDRHQTSLLRCVPSPTSTLSRFRTALKSLSQD